MVHLNHMLNLPPKSSLLTVLVLGLLLTQSLGLVLIYRSLTSILSALPASTVLPAATDSPASPSSASSQILALQQQIAALQAETAQLKSTALLPPVGSLAGALPDLNPTATQAVTLVDSRYPTVEVHELPLASSKVVGYIQPHRQYHFTSKQGDWYQIQLPEGPFAWIHSQFVTPI